MNDTEVLDTDEPGQNRRNAILQLAQNQPNLIEDRNKDEDDPNAEPVETVAGTETTNDQPLNNGRADGDAPDPPLTASPADIAAATPTVNAGGEGKITAVEKQVDASKSTSGRQALPKNLQVLDKNQDGQISLAEWPKDKLAEFTKLDKNKNGFLSSQEWRAGLVKVDQDEAGKKDADDSQVPNDRAVDDQPTAQEE